MMIVEEEHEGTCVALWQSERAPVVRILSVDKPGRYEPSISYESTDGYREIVLGSMWHTLDQLTEDWRPATEEETAEFLRSYDNRTVPNWY